MAKYVVGDIQGCYSGLRRLLDKVNFDTNTDTLYAVGDLIARGEDSLSTINFLRSLGEQFKCVLGNHDLHFLAVSQGIKKVKRGDKLEPLLSSPDIESIIDWYRQWPLAYAIDRQHTMVHAGLYPQWSVQTLIALSDEFSRQLKSVQWRALLESMYGSGPANWAPDLAGQQRIQYIVNATTRMRFIDAKGGLNLDVKCAPDEAQEHLKPWFTMKNPHLLPHQKIVFGHWASLLGKTGNKQYIALDTGYVWGQAMTVFKVENNRFIQLKA